MARKPTPKKDGLVEDKEEIETPFLDPNVCQEAQAAVIWSYDDTGHQLNMEQALFCRSYIIDRNPVAAMRRLAYAGSPAELRKMADHYLKNLEVQACIATLGKRVMERLEVTAENVNRRLASVAFFDPRTVTSFDHNGMQIKHSKFWSIEEAWAISGVKEGKDGVELKFHDGVRAAEMLGKQLGIQPNEGADAAKAAADSVIETILTAFRRHVGAPPALASPIPAKPN